MSREQARANRDQRETIVSLSKLLASKDIGSFASLEAVSHNQMVPGLVDPLPMDDESVARALAERYASLGMDPNLALAPDSDPLADFGGKEAFYPNS